MTGVSVTVGGRIYRSRAVARWREFSVQLRVVVGPDWDPALPDYDVWLDGPNPTLIRVLPLTDTGPAAAWVALDQFIAEAAGMSSYHLAVVRPGGYELPGLGEWTPGWPYAGLVAQFVGDLDGFDEESLPGPAVSARCAECDSLGLIQTEQSWRVSPMWALQQGQGCTQADEEDLRMRWNVARERTRAAPRPS